MKRAKKIISLISMMAGAIAMTSCAATKNEKKTDALRFNPENYTTKTLTVNGRTFSVKCYENIVYVSNPADVNYEIMNIYIPEDATNASPIFFPNEVGGYMPGKPGTPDDGKNVVPGDFRMGGDGPAGVKEGMPATGPDGGAFANGAAGNSPEGQNNARPPLPDGMNSLDGGNGMPPLPEGMKMGEGAPAGAMNRMSAAGPDGGMAGGTDAPDAGSEPNAIAIALSKGMTVAAPGARGRTEKYGHAPACIVDLKAAVRYLRHNKDLITGDTEKIISNGTSAGGALSALLGASGNSKDYDKYLKEIGAADERDDIFAVSAYCPITNLENANAAYEWMFNGINDYEKMDINMIDFHIERKLVHGELTEDEIKVSDALKAMFPAYVNSLELKDADGNALTLDAEGHGTFEDYIKKLLIQSAQAALDNGTDLSDKDWIKIENGKVTDMDFEAYKKYLGRQKLPGAFDSLNNDTGENNLFGDDDQTFKHFTEYAMENSLVDASMADSELVKIMNAMNYVDGKNSTPAGNWRIRAGTKDSDTASAISAMLALELQMNGKNVDYCLPWDVAHRGDYDLNQLFDWIEEICR